MDRNYNKTKTVTCSGNLKKKPRLSAFEDFARRTLNVLHGVWSKLNYIRELRGDEGRYNHWGLTRIHGEAEVHKAVADVHSELYLQLLRTPLPELLEQLRLSAEDSHCSVRELIGHLNKEGHRLIPDDVRGGSPQHLQSVLQVTDLLVRYSKAIAVNGRDSEE
jgi:hypothetical protein